MLNHETDNLHKPADGPNQESNSNKVVQTDKEKALDSINASNAEESEDHAVHEANHIPLENYETFDLEKLTKELHKLTRLHKVTEIKDHAEEIKKVFTRKYADLIEEKKEAFFEENPDANDSDFEFNLPIKHEFEEYYEEYREKKNTYFKQLQDSLNTNYKKRLNIIEQLKDLVDNKETIDDALKQLNDLRDQWKNAGAIPKDKYNHLWNNYHFHIERFYDQLHLDRESRDLDFKHNLEQKQKIITRAEELLQEEDIVKAFRELQTLHRIWREEIGPVEREYREQIWDQFSEITRQLHEKRESLLDKLRLVERQNLAQKVNIISEIDKISKLPITNHNQWQKEIGKVEELRNRFFSIGKVPAENNDEVWDLFKLATRNFNAEKNTFYKTLKKEQQENYAKKVALIEKAKQYKDSEDFVKATPIMKKIQNDWKEIGHVPRKYSDQLWKEFRDACNHYFDRLHSIKNQENQEEQDAYNKKKEYLDLMKTFELSGDHKTDLSEIKNHINNWKTLGRVPQHKRFIEGKFNKILDSLFEKLNLSRREMEAVKFNNRLETILETNDKRKLQGEAIFIQRKIEEVNGDILQLENNLAYIQNPSESNSFVKEVRKNIDKLKDDLKIWTDKLDQIKHIGEDDSNNE
ncbi:MULTISPECIES: DUF349 domain-containing protein [Myroides]|uniref:DUF349 domain-containing protein n=1 Tax=Myroides albus TaxID=2562892 RepID=A0A6I3LG49_9FLAO|nr:MULTISPECIES: DUF349 domain-containing protein [Myroides]MTG97143.1 DUF349 domain-containing protein [Myroides albus]MVX35703.1 DUF349 domain-containing protein [Myroides sp. LoEW2-1]